jgi:hypothetical protein
VFFEGKPVCDDFWDMMAAGVVCRELGFAGALTATGQSAYGEVPRVFSLDDVVCRGNEGKLADCSSSDVENCDGSEGAGVVCDTRTTAQVAQHNLQLRASCFSDMMYDIRPNYAISYNGTEDDLGHYTDNALYCQVVCRAAVGCTFFSFFSSPTKNCLLFSIESDAILTTGLLKTRSPGLDAFGPAVCHSTAPALVSYRQGEDCLADGVACVAGGRGPWEGVPHIGGQPVCRDGWGMDGARVFCRQMGFREAVSTRGAGAGLVRGPFGLSRVECRGGERSLTECHHESPVTSCMQWEGAEVRCEKFEEHPGTTITPQLDQDCSTICLKGGRGPHEGNLFVRGRPVCDDDWGMEDAKVVCRQLGFPGRVNFTRQNSFGPIDTSRFSMDDVACTGEEGTIQSCRHSRQDDCNAGEGAGVVCRPHPPTIAPVLPSSPPAVPPCTLTVHSGQWALSESSEQFHMKNILYDDCDSLSYHPNTATYWLAPAHTVASLNLDLGCVRVIDRLTLKNTRNAHVNNRGLKQFSVSLSNSTSGPWRVVLTGSLPDARQRNDTCDVPLTTFELNTSMTEKEKTGRALKLEVMSWYGDGAGLQYLLVASHPPATGPGLLLGSLLMVAVVLAMAGLGWRCRDRVRRVLTTDNGCPGFRLLGGNRTGL